MAGEDGVPSFEGRLWLAGDESSAVRARIDVSGDRVRVDSNGTAIGEWRLHEVGVRPVAEGLALEVEGEEMRFAPGDAALLQALRPSPPAPSPAGPSADPLTAAPPPTAPPPAAPPASHVEGQVRDRAGRVRGAHLGPRRPRRGRAAVAGGFAVVLVVASVATGRVPWGGAPPPAEAPVGADPVPGRGERAEVVEVVDGDTIRVRLPGGEEEPVRLVGVDAPERGDPGSEEATELLTALVAGREVELRRDVSERDRFGRLLRHVFVDEVFVGEELVRAGAVVARRYPPDVGMAETLEEAQAAAQAEGVGLWAGAGAAAATTVVSSPSSASLEDGCHPSYPDVCIPAPPPDLDCGDLPDRRFRVTGPDPHALDGNGDGVACEG